MTLNHTPLPHNRGRRREDHVPPFEWENRPPPHRRLPSRMHYLNIRQNYLLLSIMRNQKRERTHADAERLEGLEVAQGWFVSTINCSTFTPSNLCDKLFSDKITITAGPASRLSLVCRLNGASDTLKEAFFLWSLLFLGARKSLNASMSSEVLLLSRDERE